MRPDDTIAEWARARATADTPPGFADRVMRAITAERGRRFVPAAVLVLAVLAGAARIAAAFALFIPR